MLDHENPVQYIGEHEGEVLFYVLSGSRAGLVHEVTVALGSLDTRCNCEDACCRKERRYGHVFGGGGCKHQRMVADRLRSILGPIFGQGE